MSETDSPAEDAATKVEVAAVTRHQSDHVQQATQEADERIPPERSRSTSHLPLSTEKRKISIVNTNEGISRRSTQFLRKAETRQSLEFDRRVDGPFGRPSVTMIRRASQPVSLHANEPPSPDATTTTTPIELATTPSPQPMPFQPEPPPLNYEIRSRKWWILGFWSLVIFDSVVCPVVSWLQV